MTTDTFTIYYRNGRGDVTLDSIEDVESLMERIVDWSGAAVVARIERNAR
jgi:hypothetical protein